MKTEAKHPLLVWWGNSSGWSDGNTPGLSEGKLAVDAWNAAIEAAADCIVEDGSPRAALDRIRRLYYPQP